MGADGISDLFVTIPNQFSVIDFTGYHPLPEMICIEIQFHFYTERL